MVKKLIIIFIVIFFAHTTAPAQDWVQTNGPGGGFNQIIFNAKKDIFLSAGTLMRSTDNGKSWANIAPSDAHQQTTWQIAIARNQDVYATAPSKDTTRIWRSTDNGNSWNRIWLSNVNSLLTGPDTTIYILGTVGIKSINSAFSFFLLRSENYGATWDSIPIAADGFTVVASVSSQINCIVDSNGVLIFGLGLGFIRSTDKGNTWHNVFDNSKSRCLSLVCGKKGNLFMATYDTAYHSTDDGLTWIPYDVGSSFLFPSYRGLFAVTRNGAILFTGEYANLYSDDDGNHWSAWKNGLPNSAGELGTTLSDDAESGFYFGYADYAYHSDNPSSPWVRFPFPTSTATDILPLPDGSFLVLNCSIWRSDSTALACQYLTYIADIPGKFLLDSNHNVLLAQGSFIYSSADTGKKWLAVGDDVGTIFTCAAITPSGIGFAGTQSNGILLSINHGIPWFLIDSNERWDISSLAVSPDGMVYAAISYGGALASIFLRSRDTGKSFEQLPIKINGQKVIGVIESMVTNVYGDIYASIHAFGASDVTNASNIYRSTDQGDTWSLFTQGLSYKTVNSMINLPDGAIAAATDTGVFILPLESCTWQSYSTGLWTKNVPSIACNSKGQLLAGSDGCGVFKSTKLFNDTLKLTGEIDPEEINFSTTQIGSTNCMDVFIKNRGLKPFTIRSFTVTDPAPFSVADASAKKLPLTINAKDSAAMTICFHPHQAAVYSSSIIWNTDLDPLPCAMSNITNLSGIATSKADVKLSQNPITFSIHPNPLHTKGEINFSLEKRTYLRIECLDILSRSIKILADGNFDEGDHRLACDLSDLADGVYVIRLATPVSEQTEDVVVYH